MLAAGWFLLFMDFLTFTLTHSSPSAPMYVLFFLPALACPRPVPSPRPSHLCTSLRSLSLFSPLFHRTAVLLPSLRLSVSLSQIIAASLSVSCFLLRNLRGKALSVSLFALFSFFLPLSKSVTTFFFSCQGCLILRRASKREEELIPNPVFSPKKIKKRESRSFFVFF